MTRSERLVALRHGRYQVLGVLAGAYSVLLSTTLTHVIVKDDDHTLCRRILAERLCDAEHFGEPPTCDRCAQRLSRALRRVRR